MKKLIYLFVLALFVLIVPTRIFGISGQIFEHNEINYKIKVTNPKGASVYMSGPCSVCGYKKIKTLKKGTIINVTSEIYDKYNYLERKQCKDKTCVYLHYTINKSKWNEYTSKYNKVTKDYSSNKSKWNEYTSKYNKIAKDYSEKYTKDIDPYDIDLLIPLEDCTVVSDITFKNETNDDIMYYYYVFSDTEAPVYENPSVNSKQISKLSKYKDYRADYFEGPSGLASSSWYYISELKGYVFLYSDDYKIYVKTIDLPDLDEEPTEQAEMINLYDIYEGNTLIIGANSVVDEYYEINSYTIGGYNLNPFFIKNNNKVYSLNNFGYSHKEDFNFNKELKFYKKYYDAKRQNDNYIDTIKENTPLKSIYAAYNEGSENYLEDDLTADIPSDFIYVEYNNQKGWVKINNSDYSKEIEEEDKEGIRPFEDNTTTDVVNDNNKTVESNYIYYIIGGVVGLLLIVIVIIVIKRKKSSSN